MPKKKKPSKSVAEMTNDELAAKVFPKEVHEELKRIVRENDEKKKSS